MSSQSRDRLRYSKEKRIQKHIALLSGVEAVKILLWTLYNIYQKYLNSLCLNINYKHCQFPYLRIYEMALTSCCGCFSLKTGTRIVGSIHVISSILWFIMVCIAIENFDTRLLDTPNSTFDHTKIPLMKGSLGASLTFSIIIFMLSVMLVIGTNNRKEIFVFPFLCCHVAGIIFSIPISVGLFCIFCSVAQIGMATTFLFLVLGSSLALNIYFCMVVYHFYQELLYEKYGRKVSPATGKIFKEPFQNSYEV
ncbi:hypothetical protein PV327_001983 [Microctonus hyperodae]|uniref:Uncharacterized protein n=1 Tax=Microctonus hyperodae TaxID=165561 RepID=A0AA39FEQ4_MICHY|nr:hypothetical protein PV327_001983 [Microctonus hyperodae]